MIAKISARPLARRTTTMLALALLLGLAPTMLSSCGKKEEGTAKAQASTGGGKGGGGGPPAGPRSVRVEPSVRGPLALEADLLGEVLAREVVALAPRESGQLLEIRVDEGDRVTAGQVVARLDQTLEQRSRTQAQKRVASSDAQIARQQAEVDAAKREIERRRALVEKNAFPAAELQRLEDDLAVRTQALEVARAQKAEARASVEAASSELDRRIVLAPFDGLVVERHVSPGAQVSPQSPLVTVVDDSTLHFVTRLSEARSASINEDTRATIRLDAAPELELQARVVRIGRLVDRESRTITLELALDLPEGSPVTLRHGMFGRGKLALTELDDVVHIPLGAIEREARVPGDKVTVWTVGADSRAQPVEVEILLVTERRIAVSGLEAGAQVIVSGTRGLQPDAPVVIAASAPTDSAPEAPAGRPDAALAPTEGPQRSPAAAGAGPGAEPEVEPREDAGQSSAGASSNRTDAAAARPSTAPRGTP